MSKEASWTRRPGDSDFQIHPPWGVSAAKGLVIDRLEVARNMIDRIDSWKGQADGPEDRVFVDMEPFNLASSRLTLVVSPPTLDIPVRKHHVLLEISARDPYPFDIADEVERVQHVLALYDAAVAAYCDWRGWVYPGALPRTDAELAWVAEHGEPRLPDWAYVLRVPKPRPVKLDAVLEALGVAAQDDACVHERAESLVEQARGLPKAKAKQVIAGWHALVSNLGTQAHWDAAITVPGWDWLSSDVFLDLRSHAALMAPQVAASGDVEAFRAHVAAFADDEEVGISGGVTDVLREVADDREIDTLSLPDVWAVR